MEAWTTVTILSQQRGHPVLPPCSEDITVWCLTEGNKVGRRTGKDTWVHAPPSPRDQLVNYLIYYTFMMAEGGEREKLRLDFSASGPQMSWPILEDQFYSTVAPGRLVSHFGVIVLGFAQKE